MSFQLNELRKRIDRTNHEILYLLKKRIEITLSTKKFKSDVADKNREKEVFNKVRHYADVLGLIEPDFAEDIFSLIIKDSKKSQDKSLKLIGFQGEHGAFGEIGALNYNPKLVPVPCFSHADVIENVKDEYLDYGIVPVENNFGGAVTEVNELLLNTELTITGSIKLPIQYSLLALKETNYQDIKIVHSHTQALSQCRSFITRNNLESKPYYDSATAAKMLINEQPRASAVIASKMCANLYNLEIIKENIENNKGNYTRFLILSKKPPKDKGSKCTIIFVAEHKAGALFSILELFAKAKINLTRIESMPIRDLSGNYYFFLDFDGNEKEKHITKVLQNVKSNTVKYRFLGCYSEKGIVR